MTINLRTRKDNKLQLNGDILTGETYPIKDFIKKNMAGKWVADQKAWKVDVAKINWLIKNNANLYIDNDVQAVEAKPNLMSYAGFLRSADDQNSDY